MKNFKSNLLKASLIIATGFIGVTTYGMFANKPLFYLFGLSGFVGSMGSIGSGICSHKFEQDRIEKISNDTEKTFNEAYHKGYQDCEKIKDDEFDKYYSKAYDEGIARGKESERTLLKNDFDLMVKQESKIIISEWSKRVSKLSREYDEKIEKLHSSYRLEIESIKENWENEVKLLKIKYETDLNATKAEYQAEIDILKSKLSEWEDIRDRIEADKRAIQIFEVEKARFEGDVNTLENNILEKDRIIREQEVKFENYQIEFKAEMRDAINDSYSRGYEVCQQDLSTHIEGLNLKIAQLETRLQVKKRDDFFDENLPSLAKIIGKNFKPVLFCGGQGSGKGTSTISIISHYAGKNGAIPICIDVGEGGKDAESTWYRAGIPSTNNVKNFLQLLRIVVANMDSYTHRTNDDYKSKPPIILICDELQTMLMGLENKEKNEFIELLTATHTRGHKRKVFPIFCNQSFQIQNMSKVINGGQINNFWQILLNDELIKYCEDNKEKVGIDYNLRQYLDSFQNQYKCAIVGEKGLKPFRHPTHHRQIQGNGKPTEPVETVMLASPPKWLEKAYFELLEIPDKAIWLDSSDEGSEMVLDRSKAVQVRSSSSELEPAKPATDGGSSHSERYEKIKSLSGELGIGENELSSFEDAIIQGMGKGKAIESILKIRKGGSKRYKLASELYEMIKNV